MYIETPTDICPEVIIIQSCTKNSEIEIICSKTSTRMTHSSGEMLDSKKKSDRNKEWF